jgi:hypothetical protein
MMMEQCITPVYIDEFVALLSHPAMPLEARNRPSFHHE